MEFFVYKSVYEGTTLWLKTVAVFFVILIKFSYNFFLRSSGNDIFDKSESEYFADTFASG